MSLVRVGAWILLPAGALTPERGNFVRDPSHRPNIGFVGPKVPALRHRPSTRVHFFGEAKVAGQRFQYVLPGPYRVRITQLRGLLARERAQNVGDESVDRPVTAADHIASPRRGQDCAA